MQNWCHHWFLSEYSQQSKTRHSTRWFVIQVVTIIRSGSTSDESALQTITSRAVRQCMISPVTTCCRCSGWSEGEEGRWASKINEMVVSHQGDKIGTLTTHTVAPHNLSPVLGATNPLALDCSNSYPTAILTRPHFRHKDSCHTLPPVVVIEKQCNGIILWRQI